MSSLNDTVTSSTERLTGRVKWFNNKAGYGFITVTDGVRSGTDVFVHHSAVQVENQQYKYLVQGEYVEFELLATPSGNHEFQAGNVSGIKSGKLMCETRRDNKIIRTNYRADSSAEGVVNDKENITLNMPVQKAVPRQSRAPRLRGEGPRETSSTRETSGPRETSSTRETTKTTEKGADENKDWTLVKGKTTGRGRGRPPRLTQESK
jgi:CspA family cold shock protein